MVDPSASALHHLLDVLAGAPHPPRAGEGTGSPPWHDPVFSERMLAVHLDHETHMASRAGWVIQRHVDWLEALLAAHGRRRRPPRGRCGSWT